MVIFSGMKMVVYYGLMGFSGDYKGSKKKKNRDVSGYTLW